MSKYVAVSDPRDLVDAINHVSQGLSSVAKQTNSVIRAQNRINSNTKLCFVLCSMVMFVLVANDEHLRKMSNLQQKEIRLLRKEVEELKNKGE